MKLIFFFFIIGIAIVSLLQFATSSQPMATGFENHKLQSRVLAALGARKIVSSSTLLDLPPDRGTTQHDAPLEPGTILLFGTGLIALSFLSKFPGGNR